MLYKIDEISSMWIFIVVCYEIIDFYYSFYDLSLFNLFFFRSYLIIIIIYMIIVKSYSIYVYISIYIIFI
jgi:hypothetical protein